MENNLPRSLRNRNIHVFARLPKIDEVFKLAGVAEYKTTKRFMVKDCPGFFIIHAVSRGRDFNFLIQVQD